MRERIKGATKRIRKFGPLLRAIELGEMAWGLWDRIPTSVRRWAWRLVEAPILLAIWVFVSQRVGEWLDIATKNWGWALLAGVLLAAFSWFVIEASRYRLVSGRVAGQTDTQGVKEGTGTITIVEPVYVPEDHAKPSAEPATDGTQQLIKVTPNHGSGMKPTQGTTVWELDAYLDVETIDQSRP